MKNLFRGRRGRREEEPAEPASIEDLIVLERYAEAEDRLKARLKANPNDLHSHLKLAEVHTAQKRVDEAVDEYLHVADEYARDGFYEKGIALLSRAHRLLPADDQLPLKIDALEQLKSLEHKRAAAVEGLRASGAAGYESSGRVLELQRGWNKLATGPLVSRLSTDQVRRLFGAFACLRPQAGEELAREGKRREELFLLVGARVETAAGGTPVRSFGPGDVLGEAALFEHTPWSVTVTVSEAGLVLTLDPSGVERALAGNPDPRGLIGALRAQGADRELATIVRKLGAR